MRSAHQMERDKKKNSMVPLLALLVLVSGAPPAIGQSKKSPPVGQKRDLYKLAGVAAAAGKIEESQKLYCRVAKMDPGFKDSKILCAVMSEELERERKRNDDRFNLGVKEFNESRYDEATHEFANIRWGPHLAEAQEYLNAKIPQARQGGNKGKEPERP